MLNSISPRASQWPTSVTLAPLSVPVVRQLARRSSVFFASASRSEDSNWNFGGGKSVQPGPPFGGATQWPFWQRSPVGQACSSSQAVGSRFTSGALAHRWSLPQFSPSAHAFESSQ